MPQLRYHPPLPCLLLIGFYCCFAACGDGSATAGQLPSATGQLNKEMTFVEVGEALVIDVLITELDNSKATFQWTWDSPESARYTLKTDVSAGTLHVEFVASEPGRMSLIGHAELARADGKTDILGIVVADVRAWGGAAARPVPAHQRITMVPDEVRSTFAFPMVAPLGTPSLRTLGSGPIIYAMSDTSVATVSTGGSIHALATGESTLTMSYGDARESILVKVVAGEMKAPRLGDSLIDEEFAFKIGSDWLRVSPSGRMTSDAKGWPVLAALMNPFGAADEGGAQVAVARWTGSGWGLELASRPYDAAEEARITVDDQGGTWLLYRSRSVRSSVIHDDPQSEERAMVLAGRAAAQSAYRHEQLPNVLDGDAQRQKEGGFGKATALEARTGGGAWAAYTSSGSQQGAEACVDSLQLAQISASEFVVHSVIRRSLDATKLDGGECPDLMITNPLDIDPMLGILPREAGETLPRVISAHGWQSDCAVTDAACNLPVNLFTPSGPGFSRSNVLTTFDYETARSAGDFSYLNVAVARDTSVMSVGASIIIGLENTGGSASEGRAIVLQNGHSSWIRTRASNANFGFRKGSETFVNGATIGSMRIVYSDGQAHRDPLHRQLGFTDTLAGDPDKGKVLAWAASTERLYEIMDKQTGLVLYSSHLPRRVPSAGEHEEILGVILSSPPTSPDATTPAVYTAPLSFADGSRVVIARTQGFAGREGPITSPGLVLTSSGRNMPFTASEITGTSAVDLSTHPIRHVGNTLYTMVASQLSSSTDFGLTWSTAGSPTTASDVWDVAPDGRFAGLRKSGNNWTLYTDDNVGNGFAPIARDTASLGGSPPGLTFGDDGSITLCDGAGTSSLRITKFANGSAQAPITINLPSTSKAFARPFHVLADGTIIALFMTGPSGSRVLHMMRRDGSSSQVSTLTLGPLADVSQAQGLAAGNFMSLALETLPNNHLVVGWTLADTTSGRRQAVVASSSDGGRTWSDPALVHPSGGSGQVFIAMAAEASGSLLVVLSDNFAAGSDVSNANQINPGPQSRDAPRMRDLMVRIDSL